MENNKSEEERDGWRQEGRGNQIFSFHIKQNWIFEIWVLANSFFKQFNNQFKNYFFVFYV